MAPLLSFPDEVHKQVRCVWNLMHNGNHKWTEMHLSSSRLSVGHIGLHTSQSCILHLVQPSMGFNYGFNAFKGKLHPPTNFPPGRKAISDHYHFCHHSLAGLDYTSHNSHTPVFSDRSIRGAQGLEWWRLVLWINASSPYLKLTILTKKPQFYSLWWMA